MLSEGEVFDVKDKSGIILAVEFVVLVIKRDCCKDRDGLDFE